MLLSFEMLLKDNIQRLFSPVIILHYTAVIPQRCKAAFSLILWTMKHLTATSLSGDEKMTTKYLITVTTGIRKGAGTDAKVSIVIKGNSLKTFRLDSHRCSRNEPVLLTWARARTRLNVIPQYCTAHPHCA